LADLFERRDLEALTRPRVGPCVSVFLPTHRGGAQSEQDPIRLKNLLSEAERRVIETGARAAAAKDTLAPARALLREGLFWRNQADGLALFLSPGWFRSYRLPLEFPELVTVADRFHLKPILPLMAGDGRFYVLALSQNEVRLLEGSRHGVHEVDLEDVPASLREALRFDHPEKELLFHIAGREGGATAVFHGHGIGGEVDKERIGRYLRLVDSALARVLQDRQSPLILAGVEYVQAIYRGVSHYPTLLHQGIPGNLEHLRAEELHQRAWPLVEPVFRRDQEAAAARYRELAGTGLALGDLREVLPAAHHGRIEVLFVALGENRWGSFQEETGQMSEHEGPEAGGEDLLDLAAVRTVLGGGSVYAVPREEVPGGSTAAAILRY
jgi:hypothetical protein